MDLMKRDRAFPQHQYDRTQEYPWTHLSESVSLAQIIQMANTLQGESLPAARMQVCLAEGLGNQVCVSVCADHVCSMCEYECDLFNLMLI